MDRQIIQSHIAAYEQFLRQEERAPATIEKYLRDVRSFVSWLDGRPADKQLAAEWKTCLLSQGLLPATVNGKVSAVNGLFRFLGWEDCRVKFLKLQRRAFRDASRDLTKSDFERLRSAASERLALLLEAICATGIRVSEVRYITVEAAQDGRVDISLKGKIRTILLPGKLCRPAAKNRLRRDISHQRRKKPLAPSDMAGDEAPVQKSGGGGIQGFSPQPAASVRSHLL